MHWSLGAMHWALASHAYYGPTHYGPTAYALRTTDLVAVTLGGGELLEHVHDAALADEHALAQGQA